MPRNGHGSTLEVPPTHGDRPEVPKRCPPQVVRAANASPPVGGGTPAPPWGLAPRRTRGTSPHGPGSPPPPPSPSSPTAFPHGQRDLPPDPSTGTRPPVRHLPPHTPVPGVPGGTTATSTRTDLNPEAVEPAHPCAPDPGHTCATALPAHTCAAAPKHRRTGRHPSGRDPRAPRTPPGSPRGRRPSPRRAAAHQSGVKTMPRWRWSTKVGAEPLMFTALFSLRALSPTACC